MYSFSYLPPSAAPGAGTSAPGRARRSGFFLDYAEFGRVRRGSASGSVCARTLATIFLLILVLVDLFEPEDVLCESLRGNVLGQSVLDVLLGHQFAQDLLQLLDLHLFTVGAIRGQKPDQLFPVEAFAANCIVDISNNC